MPGVGVDTKYYQCDEKKYSKFRKELKINDDDILLISMGDLIKRKNYVTAIKSVAKVKNSKIHYVICGDGPERENLEKLAIQLKLDKRIHFLGFRTDIKELLAISDIFLFTTLQEGLPRSMMEAMSSGLPCIASKIRGVTDLIDNGHGGYLCNAVDEDEFAKYINILSDNCYIRKEMGKNNLRKIEKFDTKNIINIMNEIYLNEIARN